MGLGGAQSTRSAETGFDAIEVPRSACTVWGTVPLRVIASSRRSLASVESSPAARIQWVVAGVDVDEYVEVEPDPFGRAAQFDGVPAPRL